VPPSFTYPSPALGCSGWEVLSLLLFFPTVVLWALTGKGKDEGGRSC